MFQIIEHHKKTLRLVDYGICQTSLEQVFNTHAAVAEQEKVDTID